MERSKSMGGVLGGRALSVRCSLSGAVCQFYIGASQAPHERPQTWSGLQNAHSSIKLREPGRHR